MQSVNAQVIKSFGKDPKVFIKELQTLMYADNNENAKAAFEEFKVYWDTLASDEYRSARIIKTADKMLSKRMRPETHFVLYLKTLKAFHLSGKMLETFPAWQKITESYFDQPLKELNGFFESSYMMFAKNTFTENNSPRTWMSDNNNWKLEIIENQPAFRFDKLNVKCLTREDSIIIYNTSGYFLLESKTFLGKGGKVDWRRGALDTAKVYALLKSYKIEMNGNSYQADSVTFYHPDYFSQPMIGRVNDIALATSNPETARSPKFFSYKKDLKIDKFAEGVEYIGGFSLQGSKVIAYGEGTQPATFVFKYNKKPLFYLKGNEFVITPERIITDKTSMTLMIDSIGTVFHPQVGLNYVKEEKKLLLTRGNTGVAQSPFFNTYHNVEIKADAVEWKMNDVEVYFKTILKDGSVLLFSKNFFEEFQYEKLQGLQDYNPLAKLKQFCEQTGQTTFHLDEYIKYLRSKREFVRFQIVQLGDEGYLTIDSQTDTVKVNEKLFNYVNAHLGRTDYDIIFFESIIEKRPNVAINLINKNMTLQGVGRFRYSDSQYVYVIPDDQKVVMLKDREMLFDGKVRAGRFEFFGKRFRFDYKTFTVSMDEIDSMRLFFPDENGMLRKVNSVIQGLTGTLYIDQANNKSGRRPFTEYPIFKATKSSKVFYDYNFIYGGVYNREKFYFQTDPFIIDSLDNFTREGLRFAGLFVSADIFPDFREELGVMEDFSLGFKKTISMSNYKGNGSTTGEITLSNEGLRGKGKVDFASAISESNFIEYFPDSMNAKTQKFNVPASALYPPVNGSNLLTHWEPYADKMIQKTTSDPINIFWDAKLTGAYIHSKKQATGTGALDFNDAEIKSHLMKFEAKKMKADTSSLTIRSIDSTKFAFHAANVKSDMNFESRIGDFKSNIEGVSGEFPYNKYKTTLGEFKWNINQKTLQFKSPPTKPIEASYFVSTHPDQDGLWFSSKDATYDLQSFVLYANKVPHIDVADSRIIPDSGKLVVRPNAEMDPLKNAKIFLDSVQKHHVFYKCEAKILGKFNFGADGLYDYQNIEKKKAVIRFHEIKVDYLSKRTLAYAKVSDTQHFEFTPRFEFMGDLLVTGTYKGIDYNGYIHPIHSLQRPSSGWWRDHQKYLPEYVTFKINDPRNDAKKQLKLGFSITTDSVHAYPSFFTLGRNYSDSILLDASSGVVYWDPSAKKFYAGDSLKIKGQAKKGNYIYVDDINGIVHGSGNTKLGISFDQVKLKTAGEITYFAKDSGIATNLVMLLDFKLPNEANKFLVNNLLENTAGLNATNNSRAMLQNAYAEILTEKHFKEAEKDLQNGIIPIFDENKALFQISEIKLKWDQSRKAWVSEGLIGLTALGETKFEKKVEGKLMLTRKRSGDELTFYFQTSSNNWYFINFSRRNMFVYSSEDQFNNYIRELYNEVTNDNYILKLSTPRAKIKFLNSFETDSESEED